MIKLLHLADIHIGMENYGRLDPETGMSTRLRDFLDTLDEAVDRAVTDRVDVVVVAGDIYRSRDPSPTHQREFARRVLRLTREGIHVMIVAGNHDIPAAEGRATSVDIFRALELPNVTVSRRIDRLRVETRSGALQVLTLPWLTRSAFLSRDEHKNLPIEKLLEKIVEKAGGRLQTLARELDSTVPTVLVGHVHVSGARLGAERLLALGADPIVNLSVLDAPNIDYVALGHIHKHQVVATGKPPVVYTGSINRVDFGEDQEEKGYVLAEIQRGACQWEFAPVKARPFLTIRAEITSDDPTGDVTRAISRAGSKVEGAVARLQLVGTRARVQAVNEREIRGQLTTAFYVTPFQRDYTDERRGLALGEDFTGRTPLDILDLYFERRNVLPERRQQLLGAARTLMED